jgi:hypothetical protein
LCVSASSGLGAGIAGEGLRSRAGKDDARSTIDDKHAAENDGWRKNRRLAIKLAARGEHTSAKFRQSIRNGIITSLEDLAQTDPHAVHIVIRDQAGFHLRDGDPRLPERIRIIDLPPYTPRLNPCEQATLPSLKRYWDDATGVLRRVGRSWLLDQVNASNKTAESH